MGITIEETGEQLTITVADTAVHIEPGLPKTADFIVPLKLENVTNLVSHTEDGELDTFEVWRIVSVLFTPLTRETLKNPVMSNNFLRKLGRIEDHTHVLLLGPTGDQITGHTLIYVAGQWLVIAGLHGNPRRTFRMTGEQGAEYQKRVFHALKSGGIREWLRFALWYRRWRATVSVRH